MVSIEVDDDIKKLLYGILGKNTTIKCFECIVNLYLTWIMKNEIEGQKVSNLPLFIQRLGVKEADRLISKYASNHIVNTLKECGISDLLEKTGIL